MLPGVLVLETGEVFPGEWEGGEARAGEVVFNTSHSGYEEIATDPSYYSQILVMTAPQQGNYGVSDESWESDRMWIEGFVCLEISSSHSEKSWRKRLERNHIPLLTRVDTRRLVLRLREKGTVWGALLPRAGNIRSHASSLIKKARKKPGDWTKAVSVRVIQDLKGEKKSGPRVALIDFGCKKNILRELLKRCSAVRVFPSGSRATDVESWNPDGILLSNGPGDPIYVKEGSELVQKLLGRKFIFGICMGHQVLAQAVGAKNYKLKFGHRGGNHPIEDTLSSKIYMASQNHGYAVKEETLPEEVTVTHRNLNDQTVAGIFSKKHRFLGVQFHPESRPGPRESGFLFDLFMKKIKSHAS